MILTRPLPTNRYSDATAGLHLQSTTGDVFGAAMSSDTMTDLISRQGIINRDSTTVETVTEPNGMTTLREVERPDAIPAETLNKQYQDLGLNFDRAMPDETAKIIADAKRAEMIRNDIMARGPGGAGAAAAGLAGGLAAMATDPLEVATAFIPVVGPARELWLTTRLGPIAGRAAVGVIEGGVGNALTEPIYYGLSRSQQLDYGMSDSLMNIGLGAVLGGALGTGAGFLGRLGGGGEKAAVRPAPALSGETGIPATEAATAPAEEPVQPGFVRMYHGTPGDGGTPADAGGSRWFSSARQYAKDYRGGGEDGLWYVDVPRSDPMFKADYADQTVDHGFTINKDFDPAQYGGAKRVAATPPPPRFDPRADLTVKQRLDALRLSVAQVANGKAVDIPVPTRPRTTKEALQRIGVRDEGGDLAAMGVRDWDKAQPFKPNVVRDSGVERDEAAHILWEQGYLRDQPEAKDMLAAEQGLGPEPDLVAAMDRAIDDELRGSARFSEVDQARLDRHQGGASLRQQVERRAKMRETLGPQADGLRDRLIDDVIGRVDAGEDPAAALRGAMGFDDAREARAAAGHRDPMPVHEPLPGWADDDLDALDERMDAWTREDYDAADAADEFLAPTNAAFGQSKADIDPEDQWILDQIEDARRRGDLTAEQEREIVEAQAFETKAKAFGEVARAATACMVAT